ncbi:hypothetical protein K466DRAFT_597407 [Polyporus arcularius HHB13444]|uniref:Copper transporter n=1 Tax=Polyporus arcularius HHB13444 TaxID=1314778 RepID=A0A5C3PJA8_9APHY|nr:hypothetical protein K466DRAFT_597407 [Polyporus arcularius HHB13444]
MMEGGWQDHLHFGLLGEHVLVAGLHLDSSWTFFVASILTIFICLSERVLTYAISKKWNPFSSRRQSRVGTALWRSCLYWLVTLDRLLYMLIGMTFSFGLIIVAVTTLAAGHFVIEYLDLSPHSSQDPEHMKEPLLPSPMDDRFSESSSSYPPPRPNRPRSRSKPDSIFIHPNHSNIARADAAAVQLGLAGDTDLVKGNVYPSDGETWEHGRGRDVARELLLGR